MRVLVLHGGDSPERAVSFRSAKSVTKALADIGVEFDVFDPLEGLDALKKACQGYDVVLPILHGKNGEDGVVQDVLDEAGARYLGADGAVSRITIDKLKTHEALELRGIKMPRYQIVDSSTFEKCPLTSQPFVLKPLKGGSSIDTVIARDVTEAKLSTCREVLGKYDQMLLEELIDGIEISAPVLDKTSLPLINIVPPDGGEFDYENKYNGKSQEICPVPAETVSIDKQNEIQKIVLKAHEILGVRHFSRSEFIIRSDGSVYMLELNTIPGLTEESLYPKGAAAAGVSMSDLVEKFINMVEE